MKTYLLTILIVCACGGVILTLMKDARCEKHLCYLFSLTVLVCLISPVVKIAGEGLSFCLPETSGETAFSGDEFVLRLRRETERRLALDAADRIARTLALDEHDCACSFEVAVQGEVLSTRRVTCRLFTVKAILRREDLRKLLQNYCDEIRFTEERT